MTKRRLRGDLKAVSKYLKGSYQDTAVHLIVLGDIARGPGHESDQVQSIRKKFFTWRLPRTGTCYPN